MINLLQNFLFRCHTLCILLEVGHALRDCAATNVFVSYLEINFPIKQKDVSDVSQ